MDLRKVIKFGKATYSMTLPKEWVVERQVEKGDVLRVEQLSNGNLEVSPDREEKEVEVKEVTIDADNKNPVDIFREVIGVYIKNYTIITIKGDIKGKIKDLRKKLQELIGLEVMEVTQNKIVAKNFMDITETDINQTIKRIFYIIKSMSEEFKSCLPECQDVEEIMEMDKEVNRNTFFMMKYLFKAMSEPHVAHELDMKNHEIFFTWEVIKVLESIANKIKMLAGIADDKEILVKTDSTEEFLAIYEKVEENFHFAIKQYLNTDKEKVHDIFRKVDENEEACNDFLKNYKKAYTPLLMDHLKDINMFTKDLAEIIVDLE